MTETTTFRTSIVDTWHDAAKAAGLVHVDGWGNRSLFEGPREAWARLAADLRAVEADLTRRIEQHHTATEGQRKRKRALLGERQSVRAALARIQR